MKKNFWKRKKILITGINGFVGSNLAKRLVKEGADVIGIIRNKNRKTLLFFEKIHHKITLIDGDITDKNLLVRILNEQKIEHIFHLAAQVEVGLAEDNPYDSFETNVRGTYTILSAAFESRKKLKSFVYASTDKVYGKVEKKKLPYREDYPLNAEHFYDVSKAAADLLCKSFTISNFKIPIVTTRFANIYGPGQMNFSALIPDAISSSLNFKKFKFRSNGFFLRDYIFVEDVVNLYLKISEMLAKKPNKFNGQIFNFGSNNPKTAIAIVKKIFELNEKQKEFKNIKISKKKINEIKHQYMDFKKVYKFLKYKPLYLFDKSLLKTINWYKKYLPLYYE